METTTHETEKIVKGNTGNYRVRHGALSDEERERQGVAIGWTCTCPAFKYREGPCKHIRQVQTGKREA